MADGHTPDFVQFVAPRGSRIEVYEGDEIGFVTDYGYGFGIPREDFEAMVAWWIGHELPVEAAAPDMLRVCRMIVHAYENADAASETLDMAYAAIAKAEGEK